MKIGQINLKHQVSPHETEMQLSTTFKISLILYFNNKNQWCTASWQPHRKYEDKVLKGNTNNYKG